MINLTEKLVKNIPKIDQFPFNVIFLNHRSLLFRIFFHLCTYLFYLEIFSLFDDFNLILFFLFLRRQQQSRKLKRVGQNQAGQIIIRVGSFLSSFF